MLRLHLPDFSILVLRHRDCPDNPVFGAWFFLAPPAIEEGGGVGFSASLQPTAGLHNFYGPARRTNKRSMLAEFLTGNFET